VLLASYNWHGRQDRMITVGLITPVEQGEESSAPVTATSRGACEGVLYDPLWPWHAAAYFGDRVKAHPRYLRSQPGPHSDLSEASPP